MHSSLAPGRSKTQGTIRFILVETANRRNRGPRHLYGIPYLWSSIKLVYQHSAEVRSIQQFNTDLLAEMKKLVEHIVDQRPTTMVLRAISRDQAKGEILELFKKTNKTLFYSDVSERLSLDLELVVELCNELEKEGLIGVLANHETKRPKAKRR